MPIIRCDNTECKFNQSGECILDLIEVDFDGLCMSFEEERE